MENGFMARHQQAPPSAPQSSKPRAIRTSVITINPAHRPNVATSPNVLPTTIEAPSNPVQAQTD